MVRLPNPVSTAPRTGTPVTYLPPDFLISAPGRVAVPFGGSGSVQVLVAGIHPVTAAFGGSGTPSAGSFVQVYEESSVVGGTGGLSAVTVAYFSESATFGGSGSFIADAEEFSGLLVSFGGEGRIQAATAGYVQPSFGGSGSTTADLNTLASFGGSGDPFTVLGLVGNAGVEYGGDGGMQAVVSTFSPSGMNKSGTFTPTTTFTTVTEWTADTTTYPGSSVSSDALLVQGNGTVTVAMSARIMNSSASQARTAEVRLILNGSTVLATSGSLSVPAADGSYTLNATGVTVANGDLITVQMLCSDLGQITLVEHADSWVHIFKP